MTDARYLGRQLRWRVLPSVGQVARRGALRCVYIKNKVCSPGCMGEGGLVYGSSVVGKLTIARRTVCGVFEDHQVAITLALGALLVLLGANTLTCISISLKGCFVRRRLTFSL